MLHLDCKSIDNTIVIVTADHAHVQEKPYVALVKNDPTYKPYFVDTVPLLIYDPTHDLPAEYDAVNLMRQRNI